MTELKFNEWMLTALLVYCGLRKLIVSTADMHGRGSCDLKERAMSPRRRVAEAAVDPIFRSYFLRSGTRRRRIIPRRSRVRCTHSRSTLRVKTKGNKENKLIQCFATQTKCVRRKRSIRPTGGGVKTPRTCSHAVKADRR
jgi:hypothetical protein